MIKFLKSIFLFLLPLLFLFLLPALIFISGGEAISVSQIVKKQTGPKIILFGRAYSDIDQAYKIISAESRGALILALGASTVMTIRSEFFLSENTFYNAGVSAQRPENLKKFLGNLSPEKRPKFIVLSLDQMWFKPGYEYGAVDIDSKMNKDPAWKSFFSHAWKDIYRDVFNGKIKISDLPWFKKDISGIGLSAVVNKNGFRNDGSYYYGQFLNNSDKQIILKKAINEKLAEFKDGQNNFMYGNEINVDSLSAVEDFLVECQAEGISVVGFLPPYAPAIYEKIKNNAPDKEIAKKLNGLLKDVFGRYKFSFYDFSDISSLDGQDNEFIDPIHGSDKIFAKIFIFMAEQNNSFGNLIDKPGLERAMQAPRDDQQIYDN